MNVKEWAQTLNGREYRNEMTGREELKAKEDGMVIVFGYSDDLMEFRGAIYDECDAYNGSTVKLTSGGEIFSEETNSETFEYNSKEITEMHEVASIWCPKELETRWLITSKIPHETFDIMEDVELYCRGIVFDAKELTNAKE